MERASEAVVVKYSTCIFLGIDIRDWDEYSKGLQNNCYCKRARGFAAGSQSRFREIKYSLLKTVGDGLMQAKRQMLEPCPGIAVKACMSVW